MSQPLNLLRFILALNVVLFHLAAAIVLVDGRIAVLGFFCVSGFLITKIVQETYTSSRQVGPFLLNRFLRIYPQYVAALLLGILAVYIFPNTAQLIIPQHRLPLSAGEWIPQFTIFGLYQSKILLVPPAWSLNVELYFYLLIGLVCGRSQTLTVAFFALTSPISIACALHLLPFGWYGSPIGNAAVFALGALLYFPRFRFPVSRWHFVIACIAYAAHTYVLPSLIPGSSTNLIASMISFPSILIYLTSHNIGHQRFAQACDVMGRLAYPIFLNHFSIAIVVGGCWISGIHFAGSSAIQPPRLMHFVILLGILGFSYASYLCIDVPIERTRRKIRSMASQLK